MMERIDNSLSYAEGYNKAKSQTLQIMTVLKEILSSFLPPRPSLRPSRPRRTPSYSFCLSGRVCVCVSLKLLFYSILHS